MGGGALATALLVGVISLDEVAFGQLLLSQPLVGGALVGWWAGDPVGGLAAGAFFQCLCLGEIRAGSSVPPDTTYAGLVGAAAFVSLGSVAQWNTMALLGLLAVGFLPVAGAARLLEIRVCRANALWTRAAERLVAAGRPRCAQAAALGGLVLFFLRGVLPAAVVLGALALWGQAALARLAPAAPVFDLLARLLPPAGLASLAVQRRSVWRPAFLAAGLAAGLFAGGVVR